MPVDSHVHLILSTDGTVLEHMWEYAGSVSTARKSVCNMQAYW